MVPADEIQSGIMYVHPGTKETQKFRQMFTGPKKPDNTSRVFVSIREVYNLKLSFLSFLILLWFYNNFHFRKDLRSVTDNQLPSG